MASANIKKDEVPDFLMAFLLDKLLHPKDVMPGHEEFNELAKKMEQKGLRPLLMYYYMGIEPNVRSKYKMVSKTFKGGNKESFLLNAKGEVEKLEKEKSGFKGLVKKALKLIKASRKRSGFPLSEEKVDKILDKLYEREGFIIEEEDKE
jgi:hypothetical protein